MGMGRLRCFLTVELPLAGPAILTGLRVVTVSTISLTTVGAVLGVRSLGWLFTDGFQRGITADTAVRLAKYFGTSAEFWMNLQSHYKLRLEHRALRVQLDSIVPLQSGAQTPQTAYVTETHTRRAGTCYCGRRPKN